MQLHSGAYLLIARLRTLMVRHPRGVARML